MVDLVISGNNVLLDSRFSVSVLRQRATRLRSSAIVLNNSLKLSLLQSNFLQSNKGGRVGRKGRVVRRRSRRKRKGDMGGWDHVEHLEGGRCV